MENEQREEPQQPRVITVRINAELHARLKRAARLQLPPQSLNRFCTNALDQAADFVLGKAPLSNLSPPGGEATPLTTNH